MRKRLAALVLAAVLGLTVVVAVVLAVTGGGGDGDKVAGPATTTTTTAPLTDTAQELVDRLAAARERTLHLMYEGNLGTVPDGGKVSIEIWWKGDRARQSIVAESPQQRQEQTSFILPSGNVACLKPKDGAWSCQRMASVATAAGQPAGIIESLVSSLHGKEVTQSKEQVGETKADCYTLDKAAGDTLCLREDGVPVKFSFSGSELSVRNVATSVDEEVFTPPAPPTGG